jgi:hypothetical protein
MHFPCVTGVYIAEEDPLTPLSLAEQDPLTPLSLCRVGPASQPWDSPVSDRRSALCRIATSKEPRPPTIFF